LHSFFRWILLLLSLAVVLAAKGTLAGTGIDNSAQIAFAVGGVDHNITSNTDTFVVDRVVDVHTSWQDSAPVKVSAGDHGRVLTFVVSNEGNSDDKLTLSHDHNSSSDFAPENLQIFLDTNHNGIFDPGTDTVVSDLSLPADGNATIFFVSTIPDDNTTQPGTKAWEILRAASESNATSGADDPSAVDTVVRQGEDNATGVYEVLDYWLESNKTARIHSADGKTHTGTRVSYTITVGIGGDAAGKTIGQVVITDAIPAGTRYVAGSLRLEGHPLSDRIDGDAGQCDGTTVRVDVGTLSGTASKQVTFDVDIQ